MGGSALHQMDCILQTYCGRHPDAVFTARMPGNFVPLHDPPLGKKKEEILALANERRAEIAAIINTGLIVQLGISPLHVPSQTFLLQGIY
ncbi:MAG: hypothetical protein WCF90_10860 [Methanomicrobiales archaeon]